MNKQTKGLISLILICSARLSWAMEDNVYILAELTSQEQPTRSPEAALSGERPTPTKELPSKKLSLPAINAATKNLTHLHSPIAIAAHKKQNFLNLQLAADSLPESQPNLKLELTNDQGQKSGENMIVQNPGNAGEKLSNLIEFIQQNIDQEIISKDIDLNGCFTISMESKHQPSTNPYANRTRTEARLKIKRELALALLESPLLPQLLAVDPGADRRILEAIID